MSAIPVVLAGDPHGRFDQIAAYCQSKPRPGVVVLLGDLNLEQPFREALGSLLAQGWQPYWIIGNHDAEPAHERHFHHLVADYPEGDLTGRVVEVGATRIAGLGGVFRGKVWAPKEGSEAPHFRAPDDLLRQTPPSSRWRGGLPLRHRATIFASVVERLAEQRADVLVTHEAPLPYPNGFGGLNRLAAAMGARLLVHGHHHRSYTAEADGLRVRGLAIEECYTLAAGDLA